VDEHDRLAASEDLILEFRASDDSPLHPASLTVQSPGYGATVLSATARVPIGRTPAATLSAVPTYPPDSVETTPAEPSQKGAVGGI
jgi:hypothetical protein